MWILEDLRTRNYVFSINILLKYIAWWSHNGASSYIMGLSEIVYWFRDLGNRASTNLNWTKFWWAYCLFSGQFSCTLFYFYMSISFTHFLFITSLKVSLCLSSCNKRTMPIVVEVPTHPPSFQRVIYLQHCINLLQVIFTLVWHFNSHYKCYPCGFRLAYMVLNGTVSCLAYWVSRDK